MDFKLTIKIYVVFIVVIILSILLSIYLPILEYFRNMFIVPGVCGFIGIIIQIFRDHIAHERSKELQRHQQDHILAVTSHMANVTFDKHVIFCETYINELTNGLFKLWASGPSKFALDVSSDLKKVRQDNPTWIPIEIERKLIEFENGIAQIGLAYFSIDGIPPSEERSRFIREGLDMFKIIVGMRENDSDELKEIAASRVKEYLQGVLGIQELFNLRKKAINDAVSRI